MKLNFLVIFLAALVSLILGFIYNHPAVMGKMWMVVNGSKEDDLKVGNMFVIFITTFIFSFLLLMSIQFMVIHQMHVGSILMNHREYMDPNTELGKWYADYMTTYGIEFRTFKHVAFHGVISGIFLVFPIIGINALFERKGFKYIFVDTWYWTICFALMGGILCQWI